MEEVPTPAPDANLVGGRFRLGAEIAHGPAHAEYRALDIRAGGPVALRMLATGVAAGGAAHDALRRHASALQIPHHAGLLRLVAAEIETSEPFVATDLLEGRGLDGILTARGMLPVVEAALVGVRLAEVLAHCHAHGIRHGGVRPGNLMVGPHASGGERLKLVDFGHAAVPGLMAPRPDAAHPEYHAPEELEGRPVDERADVYSASVVTYECFTGTVPFLGSRDEVLRAQGAGPPPLAALRDDVLPAVSAAVMRGLARRPDRRWPNARALADALALAVGFMPDSTSLLAGAPPAADGATRRAHPRAAYVTPLRLFLAGGRKVPGRTEDVSEGGTLVLVTEDLAPGTRVQAAFALPGREPSAIEAEVRWSRRGRGGFAIGLRFLDLDDAGAEAIRRYLVGPPDVHTRRAVRAVSGEIG